MKVYKEKAEERVREVDYFNFYLGKYINLAVNAPKKYPSKPFFDKGNQPKAMMTPEEMEKVARRNTIILGGQLQKDGNDS